MRYGVYAMILLLLLALTFIPSFVIQCPGVTSWIMPVVDVSLFLPRLVHSHKSNQLSKFAWKTTAQSWEKSTLWANFISDMHRFALTVGIVLFFLMATLFSKKQQNSVTTCKKHLQMVYDDCQQKCQTKWQRMDNLWNSCLTSSKLTRTSIVTGKLTKKKEKQC